MATKNSFKFSISPRLLGAEALPWIPVFAAIWIFATYAHLFFGDYEANIALRGFSAIDFSNSVLLPNNFARDYPGGAWSTGNSLLSWVYPLLASVGITPDKTMVGMVALEILVLLFGANHLMRTIFGTPHPLAMLLLSTLVALSWIRYSDLARFSSPFFHGQFYGFADGLRLFAISLFLSNRPGRSSLVLMAGFAIHPIKTLGGLIFIGALAVAKGMDRAKLVLLWPYAIFIVFALAWAWFWLGLGETAGGMSSAEFFRYSPILNSHWYPQNLGVVTDRHWQYMTPFLAAIMVGLAVLMRNEFDLSLNHGFLLGLGALLLVTLIGISNAWFEASALLAKVSLQRASLLALSIAAILLTAQTIEDIINEKWWYGLLGLALITIAFVTNVVWPVAIAVLYLASALRHTADDSRLKWLRYGGKLLLLLTIAYQLWLLLGGMQSIKFWAVQLGVLVILLLAFQAIRLTWPGLRTVVGGYRIARFKSAVLLLIILFGAVFWALANRRLSPVFVEQAQAYRAVQDWARRHTDPTALFMVDPCQAYGWRDYSRRSSFGSIHEWYKTGWLYNGDRQALAEGIRRGARLGIVIDSLVPPSSKASPGENHMLICDQARKNFYLPSGAAVESIATDYDLGYIVLDKQQFGEYGAPRPWPVAFENQGYVVLVPPNN